MKAPKLTRLVNDIGSAIIARYVGRFPNDQYHAEICKELGKYDLNHVEFITDIARTYVRSDLAARANRDPFKKNAQGLLLYEEFERADFESGIIRLGDHYSVKMVHARAEHWITRQLHQQRAAIASQQAAAYTSQYLSETPPGVLQMKNPDMAIYEAMEQLRIWGDDDKPEPTQPQASA